MENLDIVVLNHLQSFLCIEDRMKPLYKKWTLVYREDPFYKNRTGYPMNKYIREQKKGMKWATRYDRIDWITYFVRIGNSDYWTLGIYEAAKQGNIDLVKFFIKKGADQISNAIAKASGKGHWEIVKYFIESGEGKYRWQDSINAAAREGRLEMVQFLTHQQSQDLLFIFNKSSSIEVLRIIKECYYHNNIVCAAMGGNMELIQWFIQQNKGEHIDWASGLRESVISGKLEVVKFFLSRCELVVKKTGPETFDQGDLDYALEGSSGKYGNAEIFHFLLSQGAHITKKTFCSALEGTLLNIIQIIVDHIGISKIVNDHPKYYYRHLRHKCMFDFLNDLYIVKAIPILEYRPIYDPVWHYPRKFY